MPTNAATDTTKKHSNGSMHTHNSAANLISLLRPGPPNLSLPLVLVPHTLLWFPATNNLNTAWVESGYWTSCSTCRCFHTLHSPQSTGCALWWLHWQGPLGCLSGFWRYLHNNVIFSRVFDRLSVSVLPGQLLWLNMYSIKHAMVVR